MENVNVKGIQENELKSIIKEAIKLVEYIKQGNLQLAKNINEYDEQIKEQRLGVKQGREMIKEQKETFQSETRKKASNLLERLNATEQYALQRIADNRDPVTTDNVAELQLLSQLDTTEKELSKYVEKYSNNELALRTIEKIAKEQDIMIVLPKTEEEKLKEKYSTVRTIVNSYNTFSTNVRDMENIVNNFALDLELEALNEML